MPLIPFFRDNLDSLITSSEGSQLISYQFGDKQLEFQLFHAGRQALINFAVPTDTVHGRTVQGRGSPAICTLELIPLQSRLLVRRDRYMPPTDSQTILKDAQERVSLAYGRRADEHRYLLTLSGEITLLCCLVKNPSDITWTLD